MEDVRTRFTLTTEISELQKVFPWAEFPNQMTPRYNIAPSQPLAVIANQNPNKVDFFIWGLIPNWAKEPQIGNRLINARAETLTQKPAFRSAFAIIAASSLLMASSSGGEKGKQKCLS